jgi:hypothetical protein
MPTCKICNKENDLDNMTSNGYYCKVCYYSKYHKKRNYRKTQIGDIPHWIGKVKLNAGEFYDKEQEMIVTQFLRLLGWKRSKNGNFYDDKIRDRDGNWLVDIESYPMRSKTYMPSKYYKWIQKNNKQLPKVRYTSREPYFTDEELDAIQKEYFDNFVTSTYLAAKYQCDPKEIKYIIFRTYKLIQHMMTDEKVKDGRNKGAQ